MGRLLAVVLTVTLFASVAAARPPQAAFAPVRLRPLPAQARATCLRLQARVSAAVLCPRRVPRPTLAVPLRPRRSPQPLRAEFYGVFSPADRRGLYGVGLGYGAPVEPASGRDWWRQRLWWNRPCCFLHFTVARFVPGGGIELPRDVRPARLGGLVGRLRAASSWGPGPTLWWANHAWFFWRRGGNQYVASLHRFGGRGETVRLLGRLLRELRPASELPR